jgi:hypothetical protein
MTEQMASPEPAEPPAGLTEADARGCRWIEGEATPLRSGMFCCAPTRPGSSWCSTHRQIVWSDRRASRRPARRLAGSASEGLC